VPTGEKAPLSVLLKRRRIKKQRKKKKGRMRSKEGDGTLIGMGKKISIIKNLLTKERKGTQNSRSEGIVRKGGNCRFHTGDICREKKRRTLSREGEESYKKRGVVPVRCGLQS